MAPSRNSSSSHNVLAKYTPDRRQWRWLVAGIAAIGAPLAMYAAFAVASGVKSGMIYNLTILLCGILALVLPSIAAAALLAPNSGLSQTDTSNKDREDAIETLKQRYAAGEINRVKFEQQLDDLIEVSEGNLSRRTDDSTLGQLTRDGELEQ